MKFLPLFRCTLDHKCSKGCPFGFLRVASSKLIANTNIDSYSKTKGNLAEREAIFSLSLSLSPPLPPILLQNWSFQTVSAPCSQPAAAHPQHQQLSHWFQKSTTRSRPWVVQGCQAWRRGSTPWDSPSSTPSKSVCVDPSPTRSQSQYRERRWRTQPEMQLHHYKKESKMLKRLGSLGTR